MQKVSVVIPAYNEDKFIGRLLKSLRFLPQENILEILVVDNGSTDKTQNLVVAEVARQSKLRLLIETKKGVVWARNRGAKEAKGEIIIFLDADAVVSSRWLAKVLNFFDSPKVVAVSGPTYYDDVPRLSKIGSYLYWWFTAVIVYHLVGYVAIFANFAMRRASLEKIGGIDTAVEFYGDDTHMARRLSKVGKVIFSRQVWIFASGRQFNTEGLFRTSWRYALNFFSEIFLHKSVTKGYTEIR